MIHRFLYNSLKRVVLKCLGKRPNKSNVAHNNVRRDQSAPYHARKPMQARHTRQVTDVDLKQSRAKRNQRSRAVNCLHICKCTSSGTSTRHTPAQEITITITIPTTGSTETSGGIIINCAVAHKAETDEEDGVNDEEAGQSGGVDGDLSGTELTPEVEEDGSDSDVPSSSSRESSNAPSENPGWTVLSDDTVRKPQAVLPRASLTSLDEKLTPLEAATRARLTADDFHSHLRRDCQFYTYIGPIHFAAPPLEISQELHPGVLVVHKVDANDAEYRAVWVLDESRRWARCKNLEPHPDRDLYPDRVLALRKGKVPAWVSKVTAQSYAREKRLLDLPLPVMVAVDNEGDARMDAE